MSQTVKLSIIVPVFNAEPFIEQCIRSVLDQPWRDLELILVNDGSTDSSLQICLQWEADPRVRILSTENRGIGLVFQNYALYPHMTVKQNILFPLQNLRGKDKMTKEAMLELSLIHI